jgi:hypothetical protein
MLKPSISPLKMKKHGKNHLMIHHKRRLINSAGCAKILEIFD